MMVPSFFKSKYTLTLWMNHLLVIYAFLFPISTYAASFIFSLILSLFILRRNFKEYLLPVLKNNIIQAFILFFLIHIVWLIGTDNFVQAKQSINIIKYSLFPIIFLSFLDKSFSKYVITGFIAGMLYSELFSYALHFQIIPWEYSLYSIPIYKSAEIGDPSPFLNHSHYAASLALVSALLLYKLIKIKTTNIEKVLSLFFIITISINLSLVGGRIGYVLYAILILFLTLYIFRKKILIPLFIFILLLGSFYTLAYNFSPLFQNKIKQTAITIQGFTDGNMDFTTSLGQRIGFWYYSLDIIKKNPIFGVGTGDYMDVVQNSIPESENNYLIKNNLEHPHNIYIQLLLQFGVIGLLVFINLIYKIIKYPGTNDFMQFIKYSIVLTILISLITETFVYRYYLPIFVIFISATIASKEYLATNDIIFSKKTFGVYALLLLLSILNAKLHFLIATLKQFI